MPPSDTVIAAIPALVRAPLEPLLPSWIDVRWYASHDEVAAIAPEAEIGWFDMYRRDDVTRVLRAATRMRWFNTFLAGMDGLPLGELHARGVVATNGAGLNAVTIAEYVLLGMLTIAKGYREVVQAQGRREWLRDAPGKAELAGSRALILGYGTIGQLVEQRLRAFDVEVSVVRRQADGGDPHVLGPDQWRPRLGEFDWIIIAVPGTPQTTRMIGTAELAAMKTSAVLLNVARGSVVDQDALTTALAEGRLGAAFLDVTEPEPLPPEHPLWTLPNAHITMHLSGRSQTRMMERAAERFADNLARYRAGTPLRYQVDLLQGY